MNATYLPLRTLRTPRDFLGNNFLSVLCVLSGGAFSYMVTR